MIWQDRIVPRTLEVGFLEPDLGQFIVSDLFAKVVPGWVEARPDLETLARGDSPNEVHDGFEAHQGASAPVLSDVAEHAMLDLIPLARTGRKVAHRNCQPRFVDKLL